MKILVTGGAGFIASHVVDAYIEAGHEVFVVDDLSTGNENNINPKAKFYKLNIQDTKIADIFQANKFDAVNHHAAQMDVRRSVADPIFDARVNVLGTLNLLQNSVEHQVKKFIFASTGGAIYGEQDVFPADESHQTWPVSPYGITKLSCEKYLFYFQQVFGLPYLIFRYANIYGPRQNPHGEAGVVAIFIEKFLKGTTPVINGDGRQTRDYLYVSDVVQANLLGLGKVDSNTFNLGTSVETDVNAIYNNLSELTGTNAAENHGSGKLGEQLRSCLSYEKIKEQLDWRPEVNIKEGLKNTVAYFRKKEMI